MRAEWDKGDGRSAEWCEGDGRRAAGGGRSGRSEWDEGDGGMAEWDECDGRRAEWDEGDGGWRSGMRAMGGGRREEDGVGGLSGDEGDGGMAEWDEGDGRRAAGGGWSGRSEWDECDGGMAEWDEGDGRRAEWDKGDGGWRKGMSAMGGGRREVGGGRRPDRDEGDGRRAERGEGDGRRAAGGGRSGRAKWDEGDGGGRSGRAKWDEGDGGGRSGVRAMGGGRSGMRAMEGVWSGVRAMGGVRQEEDGVGGLSGMRAMDGWRSGIRAMGGGRSWMRVMGGGRSGVRAMGGGRSVRFENEETEINRFVVHLREKYPEAFANEDMRSMADVISVLEQSFNFRTKEDLLAQKTSCLCPCSCNSTTTEAPVTAARDSSVNFAKVLSALNLVPDANDTFTPLDLTNWSTPMSFSNAYDDRFPSRPATTKASSDSSSSTAPLFLFFPTTRSSLPPDATFSNSSSPVMSTALLPTKSSSPNTVIDIVSSNSPSSSSSTTTSSSSIFSAPSFKLVTTSDTTSLKSIPTPTGSGRRKRNSLVTDKPSLDGISGGIMHALHLNTIDLFGRLNPNHFMSTRELGVSSIMPEPAMTVETTEESFGYSAHVLHRVLTSRLSGHVTRKGIVTYNSRRLSKESGKYTGSVAVDEGVASSSMDKVGAGLSLHSLTHRREIYGGDASAVPGGLSSFILDGQLSSGADKPIASAPDVSLLGDAPVVEFNPRIKRQSGLQGDVLAPGTGSQEAWQSLTTLSSTGQTKTSGGSALRTTSSPLSTTADLETTAGGESRNGSLSKQTSAAEWITGASNVTQTHGNQSIATTVAPVINATANAPEGKIGPAPSIQAAPQVNRASATVSSVTMNDVTANASTAARKPVALEDIFVLEINNIIDSFFLVAEFIPHHVGSNDTKNVQYSAEYSKVYKSSKALHFISLSILSVMVLEHTLPSIPQTAIKLFCTGCAFFKKKFELRMLILVGLPFHPRKDLLHHLNRAVPRHVETYLRSLSTMFCKSPRRLLVPDVMLCIEGSRRFP
ncbi:hypothetical protein Btru_029908 [Bulinus truncatus]|nr:hypothetical protein Btru_029908 [Bulinus truncatus]